MSLIYSRKNGNHIWLAVIGAQSVSEDKENDDIRKRPFTLENFEVHRTYIKRQKYYDVGMIRFDTPINLDFKVNTVCLPQVMFVFNIFYKIKDICDRRIFISGY